MRVEARIFEVITAFFFVSAVIYGLWSHGEPVGSAALTLTGGLTLIIGTYFR
ncbi:MAG TPA: cytochrome c oxidase subunit 4, partial [Pseudonocardiaceae bacterium]|nr:cytochrome c oxidase subunit 4 [Pseudonocardiaceae bacterium]